MRRGKLVFLASVALALAAVAPVAAQLTVSPGTAGGADNIAPAPVTNLAAEAVLIGPKVNLTWVISVDDFSRPVPVGQDFTSGGTFTYTNDVAEYTVWRSTVAGTYAKIDSVDSGINAYTDTTVASGNTYTYRVLAVDAAGNESAAAESGTVSLGPPPAFAISPALTDTINLGQVGLNGTATAAYVISNTVTDTTAILNVAATVSGTGFAVSAATKTIKGGKSDTLKVTFSAAQAANRNGIYTGSLTLHTNDANNPHKVAALKATIAGALAPPILDLSGLSITFPAVQVGQTSSSRLKITNKGGFALQTKVTKTGDAAFSISKDTTTVSVAPSDSLVVTVAFTPDTAKSYSATITVASNDPSRPTATVAVSGAGRVGAAGPKIGVDASGNQVMGLLGTDLTVGFDDFFLFADYFGSNTSSANFNTAADFNGDGKIDFADFFIFADNFGKIAVTVQ